jgi:hypothetical protein
MVPILVEEWRFPLSHADGKAFSTKGTAQKINNAIRQASWYPALN